MTKSRKPRRRSEALPRVSPPVHLHAAEGSGAWKALPYGRLVLAVSGVLAVALLCLVFGPHRIGDYWAESDFYGGYVEGARQIARGHLDPARYGVVGPVYEIVLAIATACVRDPFLAGQLISVAAAVATALLWFHLLARRGQPRLGLVTALFLAANAYFFRYGYAATTDALAMCFQAAALFLLFGPPSRGAALSAGVVAGLAFLTRYNGAYLLPAGLIALLADRQRPGRRMAASLFLLGLAIPVGAWILFSVARGVPPTFQLHHIIAYEVFARSRGLSWDDYQERLQPTFHSLWDVIARDPRAVFSHLSWNAVDHLRLDASVVLEWPVAVTAALGLAIAATDPGLRALWPIAAAGGLLFLTLIPVAHGGRYSLPLTPIYAALAAAAFASRRFALPIRSGLWLKTLLLPIVIGASLWASVTLQSHDLGQLPVEILEVARPLRQQARPGDRIITRKPHIAYYGNVTPLPFPFVTRLEGLADYARRERARWLFFSVYEARTRPELAHLLDTTGVIPGLSVRAVTTEHPSVLYEIGPAFGTPPEWFGNDTLRTVHAARAQLLVAPADPLALRTLAAFAVLRGRLPEARGYLERLLVASPGDAEARTLLDRLEREGPEK